MWLYALAYLVLSLLDTWLTFRFVRDGTVQEMNPLLRPLVTRQPALFFMVKNVLALAGLFAVARFHSWRMGELLLRATLLGYLVLDGYWLWLLVTVMPGRRLAAALPLAPGKGSLTRPSPGPHPAPSSSSPLTPARTSA